MCSARVSEYSAHYLPRFHGIKLLLNSCKQSSVINSFILFYMFTVICIFFLKCTLSLLRAIGDN